MRVTWGMRMNRAVDPRQLQLKIRVRAPKGTPRDDVLRTVLEAAESGVLTPGYQIHWIDWRKGREGTIENGGRIDRDVATELRNFVHALTDPHTHTDVNRVDDA